MNSGLGDAIERLYQEFAGYRLPAKMEYCEHCVSPVEAQVLLDVPLRSLTGQQLERFAIKAMSTWGDEHDFKHFLPRLLELLVTGELGSGFLLGRTLGMCSLYGRKWPQPEQAAIGSFRDALWRDFISAYPSVITSMGMLEALADFDQPITMYLNEWGEADSAAAIWHLRDFAEEFVVTAWSDCLLCHELDAWLAGGVPVSKLREAAGRASDEDALVLLDRAGHDGCLLPVDDRVWPSIGWRPRLEMKQPHFATDSAGSAHHPRTRTTSPPPARHHRHPTPRPAPPDLRRHLRRTTRPARHCCARRGPHPGR